MNKKGYWRTPNDDKTEVMLLGVYHMVPPEDVFALEPDDVMTPERQSELETLADRLCVWNPDAVCGEFSPSYQDLIDTEYERYRTNKSLTELPERLELVQIAFRVAKRLDHSRVHGVDELVFHDSYPEDYGGRFTEWWEGEITIDKLVDYSGPSVGKKTKEYKQQLEESSIPEFLSWINQEEQLMAPSTKFALLEWADDDGLQYVTEWMERNIRIVRNLALLADDYQRILLVIGSGHIPDLRHLITRSPSLCPVGPLGILSKESETNQS